MGAFGSKLPIKEGGFRPTDGDPRRTVLLGVDNSSHSKQAFKWYATSPGATKDRVIIHHTIVMAATRGLLADKKEAEARTAEIRGKALELKSYFENQCSVYNLQCEVLLSEADDPRDNLLQAAFKHKAGLIVLGSRGHGPLGKFLGSVSEHALHYSDIPIVVVPPKCQPWVFRQHGVH